MFENYFRIAVRQLAKHKMYSAIKIGGFALSISACLLIGLYIRHQLHYDNFYPEADRIFRTVGVMNDNGVVNKGTSMPPPFGPTLKKDFPEVEIAGRLMNNNLFRGVGDNYLRRADGEQNTYEQDFAFADQELLDILQPKMVYGERSQALAKPFTMVISKSKAEKYFPGQNPVGKIMYLNDNKEEPYTIGGVMDDFPVNSHLQYSFLLTLTGKELWRGEQTDWGSSNYDVYVMLRPGTNPRTFEKKVTQDIIGNYMIPMLKNAGSKDIDRFTKNASIKFQPVRDIHLRSFDIHDGFLHGDIRFVWLFAVVACFILLIACINFINLSTARSVSRAKEVGMRKVVGSTRNGLVRQFLTESVLFSVLSFIIGILLARILLPYFNQLSSSSLTIPYGAWWLIPVMLVSAIVVGVIAGLYPAFYLSSFNPVRVMKGLVSRGGQGSLLRNILVVFQFTTSTVLIISTFIVFHQMKYILNKKVGFEKDQVIMIEGTGAMRSEVNNFKTELLRLPTVSSVSISDFLPVTGTKRNGNLFHLLGKEHEEGSVGGQFWDVDHDYIPTMGMKIVEGRNFSAHIPSDSQAVIINQTMANKLNLKDPIGKMITNGDNWRVIGVVQDFNFESMRDNIGSLCMRLGKSDNIVSMRVNTNDMGDLIASVSNLWKKFAPAQPIRYSFLDDRFANMYADVQRMGRIFTTLSILAVMIAGLGLFALSAFMAEQRTKEIGVRKVLGATVANLASLLSRDFLKLVVIAVMIASPIAWWAMNRWLQDFAYRDSISLWIFLYSALLAILIALLTISTQAIRAALANPVKSLRSE